MNGEVFEPGPDLTEAQWEALALEALAELGWEPVAGSSIAPGTGERESWSELILLGRLRDAIARLNPQLPTAQVDETVTQVLTVRSRDAVTENRRLHELMVKGLRSVVYTDQHGAEHNPTVRLIDFRDEAANDYLAVSQVSVTEGDHKRRFDVVCYLNGLPVGLIELKKASDAYADLRGAHRQVGTYVEELPLAFRANVVCLVSDGITARYGTAFTPFEHFAPWNVDDNGEPVSQPPKHDDDLALNLALYGLFTPRRFLELLRGYVAFADGGGGAIKRIAKPHQYFAVEKAVRKTIEATRSDGKAGVVWHTQGSGKSMEMEFYAHQVATHPSLGNPTIVVITDRTDLDEQLLEAFVASELLPERPVQAVTREGLRTELTNRRTGGIIFTTLQKFGRTRDERESGRHHPLLSDRRNVIVIVDEAHRSHYDSLDGYARHLRDALPHATLIAFTGTPISQADRDTQAVFGDYIDIYDLTRAVDDGATVRVYHESRLIPVDLPADIDPETIDERADTVTAGLDDAEKARIQRTVAVMNAVYGAPDRVEALAADLVAHWQTRSEQMRKYIGGPGKAMIVCATRDICARVYDEMIALLPDGWHSDADDLGKIKVIYTGGPDDEPHIRKHVRRPSQTKVIRARAKNSDDELELIIVQSMLLTGFDSPSLHTLYLDKPMRGAALMQALARVNRTFRGKEDGLLVGYAPITQSLHEALAEYTKSDQDTKPVGRDTDEAVAKLRDLHDVLCGTILAGYDWRGVLSSGAKNAFMNAGFGTIDYLRDPSLPENQPEPGEPNLAERFRRAAATLDRLYALCSSSGDINDLRDDIAFFQAVRVWMAKFDVEDRRSRGLPIPAEVALYLRQLTAGVIEAGGVTDIYAAAGIDRPDLSHLDEAYLEQLRASKTPNLAIEALRRAIEMTMRKVTRHNIVRQEAFSARLLELMRRYTNQNLTSAEIIAQLVAMAKEVSAEAERGQQFSPALTDDELAFYDAVAENESAVVVMGEGQLAAIARDLVKSVRRSITIDWTSRDDVRAKLRSTIKRLLAVHGYPPDAAEEAIRRVLLQTETFAEEWSPEALS
ncbi:type I restriction endonuclease subunit R [Micromonospora sp. MED01]|uniref:type I restriction endonuclease subunit R n=1 Tax=Micromonospora alfalfae TaxID=2911212 RepID=UPI001EE811C8|nr:type I restriction endonuclease subunit R [Micromonospora alfalfae]MCG5463442.1 type I restriction endonuclease subunit R [Micromonospora alfalfae]